jgi:hypothetical protein
MDMSVVMILGALGFFILMLTVYDTVRATMVVFCISGLAGVMLGNSTKKK